jgi:hypothetical protein
MPSTYDQCRGKQATKSADSKVCVSKYGANTI